MKIKTLENARIIIVSECISCPYVRMIQSNREIEINQETFHATRTKYECTKTKNEITNPLDIDSQCKLREV